MHQNIEEVHEGSCTAEHFVPLQERYIIRLAFWDLKLRGLNFELHHSTPVCPNMDLDRLEITSAVVSHLLAVQQKYVHDETQELICFKRQ